jgi:hypothetical protein
MPIGRWPFYTLAGLAVLVGNVPRNTFMREGLVPDDGGMVVYKTGRYALRDL